MLLISVRECCCCGASCSAAEREVKQQQCVVRDALNESPQCGVRSQSVTRAMPEEGKLTSLIANAGMPERQALKKLVPANRLKKM